MMIFTSCEIYYKYVVVMGRALKDLARTYPKLSPSPGPSKKFKPEP